MSNTAPFTPLTVTAEPRHRVLAADPIPADTCALEGMPGQPITRDQMRTPAQVLPFDVYVVQIRSEGVWTLPNHDDGSVMRRGHVAFAVRKTMDYWPQRPGRASLTTDGTLYVSNGRQAARYIPAERFSDWQPTSGTCPGCCTSYADNGDGPCPGGRSTPKHDFAAEAARLLGDGQHWVRHWFRFGMEENTITVQRADAVQSVLVGLRVGATVYQADAGGVNVEASNGESSYWLEPLAEESIERTDTDKA
ncbi:hypothetical protein ACFVYG_22335 [Streptomyces sp. NPDC058256]|uniref:hypothetical protein n=1 Tax=Streptomyces sp. NPDC058256 TaxID=3346408 RepID=UPI0036EF88F6